MPEQKDTLLPPLNERIAKLDTLSKQYGGSEGIPDTELKSLGYYREQIEGGWRLIPVERMDQRAKEQLAEQTKMQEKIERTPLKGVSVQVPETDIPFRDLFYDDVTELTNRVEDLIRFTDRAHGSIDSVIKHTLSPDSPYCYLFNDFSKFLDQSKDKLGFQEQETSRLKEEIFGYCSLYSSNFSDIIPEGSDAFVQGFIEDERAVTISQSKSEALFTFFERQRGTFADMHQLNEDFQDAFNDEIDIGEHPEKRYPQLQRYITSHKLTDNYTLITNVFGAYLEHLNLEGIAATLQHAASPQEATKLLQEANFTRVLDEERRTIKASIQSASIEEKKQVSKQLKEIEQEIKRRKQIQKGMQEYFSSPQIEAKILGDKIKNIQELLANEKKETGQSTTLYLDATPDPAYDTDPGVVSGDCTEGEPLPFIEPSIPLYNTKVFNNKRQHIGNMYLLVTTTETVIDHNPMQVWHFDAIQIPNRRIDWKKAIQYLIESIGKEAAKQDIDLITVNGQEYRISNYDYIDEAVREYGEERGDQFVSVNIPEVEEEFKGKNYSSLQGNGGALVLWTKPSSSK